MARYKLTEAAAIDFEEIFEYGMTTFGLERSLDYQNGMIRRFLELCEQPELYPVVEHINKSYRRSVYGSHSIYFRVLEGDIIVTRILGRQDTIKAFWSGNLELGKFLALFQKFILSAVLPFWSEFMLEIRLKKGGHPN